MQARELKPPKTLQTRDILDHTGRLHVTFQLDQA